MVPNVGLGTQGVQRGWGLWLTSVLAVVIAGLFVLARISQRSIKKTGLGLDDYLIIAGLVSSILLTVTECQAVVYGYGRHWDTLPPESRMIARKWFYAANIVYKVVLMFTKLAVVCLYYRIFAISTKVFRIACHIMSTWILTTGLAFTFATIFQCSPIAAFWDHSIQDSKCFKNEPWWISYATVQIATDFLLLGMPLRRILTLSMERAEKLGVVLIFSTGGFVTFASIYRATTIARSANDPDPTWGPIPATIWSVIEANTGIICACLPMLRAPFVRLFGSLFGSRLATTRKHQSFPMSFPNGAAETSNKNNESHDVERGSSRSRTSDDALPARRPDILGRRGSGIFIAHEFPAQRDELEKRKTMHTMSEDGDMNTAASFIQDRPDGKSTFYHV